MNIEFKVGYYEWNVYADGKHFYTFDDIGELLYEDMENDEEINGIHREEPDYENLENVVELCLWSMDRHLEEQNIERLGKGDMLRLKSKMLEAWSRHYGIY